VPRFRTRLGALVLLALAFGATLAVAQPKKGGGAKKPPRTTPDAGTDNPYEDVMASVAPAKADAGAVGAVAAVTDAGAALSLDAAVPAPQGAQLLDGGLRPSPLNPAPEEMPSLAAPDAGVDVDKLIADVATLRARVAAVGDNLFHSRVAVSVQTKGSHARVQRLVLSLDDGVVFTSPAGFKAEDMTPIYARGLAPGRHAITLEIERADDRNEAFKSSQRSRFMVEVPKDSELKVELKVSDDSSMGGDFPKSQDGDYDLRVKLYAEAKPVGKK
jgi:hypothetical protein